MGEVVWEGSRGVGRVRPEKEGESRERGRENVRVCQRQRFNNGEEDSCEAFPPLLDRRLIVSDRKRLGA
jgi:hypothetical protein